MSDFEYSKDGWVEAALSYVRCKAAHQEIMEELHGHIEEKEEALTSSGLTPEDAEKLAVRAMGDPGEVGHALNAAHHPIWGVILGLTKFIAVVIVLAILGETVLFGGFKNFMETHPLGVPKAALPEEDFVGGAAALSYSDEKIRAGDYTIRVEDARYGLTPEGEYTVEVLFEVKTAPWCLPPMFLTRLRAVTSAGEILEFPGVYAQAEEETGAILQILGFLPEEGIFVGLFWNESYVEGTRVWDTWHFAVRVRDTVPLDWVELSVPGSAVDFVFTAEGVSV